VQIARSEQQKCGLGFIMGAKEPAPAGVTVAAAVSSLLGTADI